MTRPDSRTRSLLVMAAVAALVGLGAAAGWEAVRAQGHAPDVVVMHVIMTVVVVLAVFVVNVTRCSTRPSGADSASVESARACSVHSIARGGHWSSACHVSPCGLK